jgi:radical SAM protein with 4Fe4S-binding SPASM domain
LDDFSECNWNSLIFSIHRQKCILLLGPDAAMEEVEGRGSKPLTELLANELANEIGLAPDENGQIDTNDLLQTAQFYEYIVKDRGLLEQKVDSFYAARKNLTSLLHQDLAILPFPLIITSTFDHMMENALQEQNKPPLVEFHNYKRPKRNLVTLGTVDRPLLYQLYGSLPDYDSLVITEGNLLDLLINVASKDAPLPDNVRSELTSNDKSLLFLGFGFRYWYLRVLLQLIKIGRKDSWSFALETIGPTAIREIKRNAMFIENKYLNIKICNLKLTDFVRQLRGKYQERYIGPERQPPKHHEKPTVFISYVRENEEAARKLKDQLQRRELEVLIDRDFLRAGVDYQEEIFETIKKIDYFIILLSNHWVRQTETWARLEVDKAFERRKKFREDLTFIIPVNIDQSLSTENLRLIHNDLPPHRGDPFHKKRCDFGRLVFAPNGMVFSCDQWLNDEKTALGDIHRDPLEDILREKADRWEEIKRRLRKSGTHMSCATCEWGRQCGGGCLTCMKYHVLLLGARARGLLDRHWAESVLPDPWEKIRGETYYCEGLRDFRRHLREAVQRELADAS